MGPSPVFSTEVNIGIAAASVEGSGDPFLNTWTSHRLVAAPADVTRTTGQVAHMCRYGRAGSCLGCAFAAMPGDVEQPPLATGLDHMEGYLDIMPKGFRFLLSDEDIDSLVAFLLTQ